MDSRQELQAYEAGQRAAARHALEVADRYLAGCDDIIVDIARDIAPSELGFPIADRRTQALYDDALDARRLAYERRADPQRATSVVAEMAAAMETAGCASRAYWILTKVEQAIFPERPQRTPPDPLFL